MSKKIDSNIEASIYVIRGQRIMLDFDLAKLYEVETRRLNERVRRNVERFPNDFMFQLSEDEYENLMSQIATSSFKHGGRRKMPLAFTENGVAMLSAVLNSENAIQVSISIMRTFTRLRSFLSMESQLDKKMDRLEKDTTKVFKIVFEKLDSLEERVVPLLPEKRRRIGLNKAE